MKTLAHKILDIERECGFEVSQEHCDNLEEILGAAEDVIDFSDDPRVLLKDVGFFLEKYGFKYQKNGLFITSLETKITDCKGAALYYLILQRLHEKAGKKDFHFYIVNTREHLFIRYDDGKRRIDWEITCNMEAADEIYISREAITEEALKKRVHMENLTEDEVKAIFYSACAAKKSEQADDDGAEICASKAIGLNPKEESAYRNRGCARYHKKDFKRALADFDKIVELDPCYENYNLRAVFRLRTGDYTGAEKDFIEAAKREPCFKLYFGQFGKEAKKRGDCKEAMVYYNLAIRSYPNCSLYHRERAELHWKNRNFLDWLMDTMRGKRASRREQLYQNRDTVELDAEQLKTFLATYDTMPIKLN
jgi:tetratricopeptide (TPR) repeat protein